jgi:hypothetical protein
MPGLRQEIARVRMQGYALADRQIEVGLCSLAVPLLSRSGQVVAALNVGVPAGYTNAAALKESPRPATAGGDGAFSSAIGNSAQALLPDYARSRPPAAEAGRQPSPARCCANE